MSKNSTKQATVIPYTMARKMTRDLPESWKKAAGMMKHHARGLDRYIKQVRKEWR